jgi:chorismate dehydratase
MDKLKISAIRYANTFPLNYGLRQSGIEEFATIEIDHPADCARKLKEGKADIGLVPVAEIENIKNAKIISDFCIGTNSPVRTVLLVSNTPVEKINTIFMDYRSRSSVALARILAKKHWRKEFVWKETNDNFNFSAIPDESGLVIIGDQCFDLENQYMHRLDLSSEWKNLTGLPFVFACWVSNRELDPDFINRFNNALRFGINNIDDAIIRYKDFSSMPAEILKEYLTINIDYRLDDKKKLAMSTFIRYIEEVKESEGVRELLGDGVRE